MTMTEVTTLTTDSIEQFQKWLSDRGRSTLTLKAYSTDLRMMLSELDLSEVPLSQLETTASQWLNLTRKMGKKPKTTTRRMTSVKAFAKWAGLSILADYQAPKPKRAVAHPLPEGMPGVFAMVDQAQTSHHRALVSLCGLAGLRVHEALAAVPEWFDLDRDVINVLGKGEVEREVPISQRLMTAIAPALIQTQSGESLVNLSDSSARAAITSIGIRALGHHVASHDLRMTFGTAINDKYGLRRAQMILGHASSSTTEGYTLVTLDQMREAVEW